MKRKRTMTREQWDATIDRWEHVINGEDTSYGTCGFCKAFYDYRCYKATKHPCRFCPLFKHKICRTDKCFKWHKYTYWRVREEAKERGKTYAYYELGRMMLSQIRELEGEIEFSD